MRTKWCLHESSLAAALVYPKAINRITGKLNSCSWLVQSELAEFLSVYSKLTWLSRSSLADSALLIFLVVYYKVGKFMTGPPRVNAWPRVNNLLFPSNTINSGFIHFWNGIFDGNRVWDDRNRIKVWHAPKSFLQPFLYALNSFDPAIKFTKP